MQLPKSPVRRSCACLILAGMVAAGGARAAELLSLETRIPLADVGGRIDHMAIDPVRNRLLVAELGNGTVDAIDLAAGHSVKVKRINGLKEPQGVGWAPQADLVIVANAGDGTVRFFRGEDLAPAGMLRLGDDADNVRIDPANGRAIVGYGNGGLAVIDPAQHAKIADIRLAAHPESFQLDGTTGRVFANVPDAPQIAVVDLAARKQIATWSTPGLRSNFAMALAEGGALLAVVFRSPAKLVLYDTKSGAAVASLDTCHDADDVFFDGKRGRLYISCGEGVVDVVAADGSAWRSLGRVETSSGARTSLFVPERDRLYVAARAGLLGSEAAILVFRPVP